MTRDRAKPFQRKPLAEQEAALVRALAQWCAKRDHDRTKVTRSFKRPLTQPAAEAVQTVDLDSEEYRILGTK